MDKNKKKVVIVGDSGVGKTSIIYRYSIDNYIFQNLPPTLGAAFHQKKHKLKNGEQVELQIWDTAGQERYRSIAKIYYKDAKVVIAVFDVTSAPSFQGLKQWVSQVKSVVPSYIRIIVVGNKTDLMSQSTNQLNSGQVSIQQAQSYCKSIQAQLKLTSALQNKGIDQLFDSVADNCKSVIITSQVIQQQKKLKLKKQKQEKEKQRSSCC